MTEASGQASGNPSSSAAAPPRRGGFPWTRTFLALAIALMVAGAGMMAYGAIRGGSEPVATTGEAPAPGALPLGLLPTDPDAPGPGLADPPAAGGLDAWSPTIFRLGFSFFAGFAIAYAVRTFLKISVLAAGVAILGLFGLQYAGVIDVNWAAISDRWDGVAGWLGDQTASFGGFIRGYLPSAATAALGFAMGFRRR